MRNVDSKIHSLGFDCFKFQFYRFFADTFSSASVVRDRCNLSQFRRMSAMPPKATGGRFTAACREGPTPDSCTAQQSWRLSEVSAQVITLVYEASSPSSK